MAIVTVGTDRNREHLASGQLELCARGQALIHVQFPQLAKLNLSIRPSPLAPYLVHARRLSFAYSYSAHEGEFESGAHSMILGANQPLTPPAVDSTGRFDQVHLHPISCMLA